MCVIDNCLLNCDDVHRAANEFGGSMRARAAKTGSTGKWIVASCATAVALTGGCASSSFTEEGSSSTVETYDVRQAARTDAEFREVVDDAMPGTFRDDDPAKPPLAFFAKTTCGALAFAEDSELADSHGKGDDPLYEGSRDDVRMRLVNLWAERLPPDDARTFVDISIGTFCPEYR